MDCVASSVSDYGRQWSGDRAVSLITNLFLCQGVVLFTWLTPLRFSWCVGYKTWTVSCQAAPLFGLCLCSCSCKMENTSLTCREIQSYHGMSDKAGMYQLISTKQYCFGYSQLIKFKSAVSLCALFVLHRNASSREIQRI